MSERNLLPLHRWVGSRLRKTVIRRAGRVALRLLVALLLVLTSLPLTVLLPPSSSLAPRAAEAGNLEWTEIGQTGITATTLFDVTSPPGQVATLFVRGRESDFTQSVYRSTNGASGAAATWAKVLSGETGLGVVQVSPGFVTDATVYINRITATYDQVLRSTDGGMTFAPVVSSPGESRLTRLSVVNATRVYAGDTDGFIWITGDGGASWIRSNTDLGSAITWISRSPNFFVDNTLFAGALNAAGSAYEAWQSIDGGLNWSQIGSSALAWGSGGLGGAGRFRIYPSPNFATDHIVFTLSNDLFTTNTDIFRGVVSAGAPGATTWTPLGSPSFLRPFNGLSLFAQSGVGDGILMYATAATNSSSFSVQRTWNPLTVNEATWNRLALPSVLPSAATSSVALVINRTRMSNGDIVTLAVDPTATPNRMLTWTDTNAFLTPPAITVPAASAVVPTNLGPSGTPLTLSWGGIAGAQCYDVQLALDSGFTQLLLDPTNSGPADPCPGPGSAFGTAQGTTLTLTAAGPPGPTVLPWPLPPGPTYYWRVRARALGASPATAVLHPGPWPAARSFTVTGGSQGAWTQLASLSGLVRKGHTAVWDNSNNQMLIFGGYSGSGNLNDLWSYRPATNSWVQLIPENAGPSGRYAHTAVWDDTNNQMLVFGGATGAASYLNDLWSYRPATNRWTDLTPGSGSPPKRGGHSAVTDFGSQMVIFGGFTGGATLNDLWSYSLSAHAWTQLHPSGALPDARADHSAVLLGSRMTIFGGRSDGSGAANFNDVWSYYLYANPPFNVWEQLHPSGTPPQARAEQSAIFDLGSAQMLVFGGTSASGALNDLWGLPYGITPWMAKSPSGGPPGPRIDHSAAWDRNSGKTLIFGGINGGTVLGDLWAYDPFGGATAPTGSLALVSGANQAGAVGTALAPFAVKVTDPNGNPVSGIPVSWAITGTPGGASGQTLSVINVTTGANGLASTVLTLGAKAGTYTVTASASDAAGPLAGSPVTFSAIATPGTPSVLVKVLGDGQTGAVATTLAQPLVVEVQDANSNPVPDQSLTFAIATVPSGAIGQDIDQAAAGAQTTVGATTDANGRAQALLTLGSLPGGYSVLTSAGALASVTFTATASGVGATITVNSTVDAVDANPGNGVCETAPANGICTLRAAIQEANARAGADTITLPAGTYTLTIPGQNEDAAATGDLDITGNLTITGAGAASTIIDGGGLDRVFHILAGTVSITGMSIRSGAVSSGKGGGIFNDGGTVTLVNAAVSSNFGFEGGGIYNTGPLTLTNTTVHDNSGPGDGGGIFNTGSLSITGGAVSNNTTSGPGGGIFNAQAAILSLTNTTLAGNTSQGDGGGVTNRGVLTAINSLVTGNTSFSSPGGGVSNSSTFTLTNSTVSENTGGGITNFSGGQLTIISSTIAGNSGNLGAGITNFSNVTIKNTIVANNNGANCNSFIVSQGHNLSNDATCGFTAAGDLQNTDPKLGPLADNGGPTMTHALLAGSPAIDAVPLANCIGVDGNPLATDQRGVSRPQGGACDIGAFESELPSALTLSVNSTLDAVDVQPGDGVCQTVAGVCTLRAAIQEANARSGADAIVLPAGVYTLSLAGRNENAAATGDLDITGSVTITGAGSAGTIIDGGRIDRVLHVIGATTIVSIAGMTVRNGIDSGINNDRGTLTLTNSAIMGNSAIAGGGIFNFTGTLTISNSTLSGNSAAYSGGQNGGAVRNDGGTVNITGSTLAGNSASHDGGAIVNNGTLTMTNSTLSGNNATNGLGGGIFNNGTLKIANGTLSGNSIASGSGGGIANNSGATTLKNTLVANNTAPTNANCSGAITSQGNNLSGDASCTSFTAAGDLQNTDPKLGLLADNGGPTQTHALLSGSLAIDAIPLANCVGAGGAPLTADQRGLPRPAGAACDIGAFEVQPPRFLAFTAQPIRGAHDFALGVQPAVVLKDSAGAVVTGDSSTVVTLAIKAGAGPVGAALTCGQTSGGVTSMPVANGVAAFTGCAISLSGESYVLEATASGATAGETAPFNVTWAGDTNGDCRVSAVDFSLVVTHFGKTSSSPDWTDPATLAYRADLNGDAHINVVDFSILVSRFGTTTASCAPASNGNPAPEKLRMT